MPNSKKPVAAQDAAIRAAAIAKEADAKTTVTAKVAAEAPVQKAESKPVEQPVSKKASPAVKKASPAPKKVAAAKPKSAPVAAPVVAKEPAKPAAEKPAAKKSTVEKGTFVMNAEVLKKYEDVVSFSKENVEALVQSGTIFAKGFQELNSAFVAFAQASVESNVKASQSLMKVKTIKEVGELQSELAKKSYEDFVAESGKLSDASIKVVEEALEPIAARFSAALEKFGKPAEL